MSIFRIQAPPRQDPIDRARIESMLTLVPRRSQLDFEWKDALHPPRDQYKNWTLVLPFCESFASQRVRGDVQGPRKWADGYDAMRRVSR